MTSDELEAAYMLTGDYSDWHELEAQPWEKIGDAVRRALDEAPIVLVFSGAEVPVMRHHTPQQVADKLANLWDDMRAV